MTEWRKLFDRRAAAVNELQRAEFYMHSYDSVIRWSLETGPDDTGQPREVLRISAGRHNGLHSDGVHICTLNYQTCEHLLALLKTLLEPQPTPETKE